MPASFDLSWYLQPTKFSAREGVTLASRLVSSAPDELGERERVALSHMEAVLQKLQVALRDRLGPDAERLQPFGARLVSAWVGLRLAIDANQRLTGTEHAKRAEALRVKVLPNGTGFTRLTFVELWPESENLLVRMDERGLAAAVDDLVGPHFLASVREAHAAFADALGISDVHRSIPTPTPLREASSALADAIVEYGRVMVGWVDPTNEASVSAFRSAMKPLDDHRAALATRGSQGIVDEVEGDDEEPEATNVAPAPVA